MMALGPDIRQNTIVDRRIESIDLTPVSPPCSDATHPWRTAN